jgi:23S rRNA (cytidine1920-2'-O)/16S rRNA (cytidine1409-2'-O)-methyltransferase
MSRLRADLLLVDRGLFASRAQAQAAIAAGLVAADGKQVKKPSDIVNRDAVLDARPAHPFVSRGGVKLAHALDVTGVAPAGKFCLDVGASTGGFTDVLLRRGARHVVAVDVGRDQLHASLRGDGRITSLEQTDIRRLDRARLPEPAELVVVDASFISLALVLPAALVFAGAGADLLALIKPQFEAPRAAIRKGIVRDGAVHAAACEKIAACVTLLGWQVTKTFPSPIEGGDGNREFFLWARNGPSGPTA